MIINRKRQPSITAKIRQTSMRISKGIIHVSKSVVDELSVNVIDAVRIDVHLLERKRHKMCLW
jgi:hypothetical protein